MIISKSPVRRVNHNNTIMVVLVTGAAHRIGRQISLTLAKQGHSIALHYKNSREDAVLLAEQINSMQRGQAKVYQADLFDLSSLRNLIGEVSSVDTLCHIVNNASSFEHDTITSITSESFVAVYSDRMALDVVRTMDQRGVDIAAFEYSSPLEVMFAESDREKYARVYQQHQPGVHSITSQLRTYNGFGYSPDHWGAIAPNRSLFGHWCTDFLAYNMRHDKVVSTILSVWFQQLVEIPPVRIHHDAVSFSFIIQMVYLSNYLNLSLASLPTKMSEDHDDYHIYGSFRMNSMFQNIVKKTWKFNW